MDAHQLYRLIDHIYQAAIDHDSSDALATIVAQAFGESDQARMALLLPHFQRAMQIRERLALSEHRGALSYELLDKLTVGVILVSADCRMFFANRVADRLLEQKSGLIVSQGVLRPLIQSNEPPFERLVAEAARTSAKASASSGRVCYLHLPLGKKLPVLVAPLRAGGARLDSLQGAAAIIFSGPNAEAPIAHTYLTQRYGLTGAEARLLSALIAGTELAEYAASARVGIGTVKTHLKSLFAKTGCHRQTEIVRTVLSDPMFRLMPNK